MKLEPWQMGAIVGLLLGIFVSITIGSGLVLALLENQTLTIVIAFVLIGTFIGHFTKH